jgi:hypothetical protein
VYFAVNFFFKVVFFVLFTDPIFKVQASVVVQHDFFLLWHKQFYQQKHGEGAALTSLF